MSAPPLHADYIDLQGMPRVLARLVKLAAAYPLRAAVALACALGAAVFNLIMPRLLGRAVEQAGGLLAGAGTPAPHALWWTALLIVGACAVRGILTGLQGYCGEVLAQRVGYDLRLAFFAQLQRLSFSFHDKIHTGELIARGMLDLEGVRGFLEFGVLRLVSLVLLLGVGAWRLLTLDLTLGLLALSFVPLVMWQAVASGFGLRISWQRLQQVMAELTLRMEENLQGVRVVRAFHARAYEMARFDRIAAHALRLSKQRITQRMTAASGMVLAYHGSMGLVLWFGGLQVAAGTLTVGALTEFLTFIAILQLPLRQISMIVNASARATGAGARLFEVLDTAPAIADAADALALAAPRGVLRFEHVDFAYGHGAPVLHDISFEVAPGQVLGIVGPPGSGKSTIAHLIPRLYDVAPGKGRVTLDGHDVRSLTLASLRRAVGLVPQENFLFDTSVHDNVAYAEPAALSGRVQEAAALAQIHEQVLRMPGAYQTRVGERGAGLSGGQRQRVTIARALLGQPAVIVLDDATAAVDPATEQQVRAALKTRMARAATIIIAHRLSSLRHADQILVLDGGRIVERGSHQALLAAGGRYAVLWRLQQDNDGSAGTVQYAEAVSA